MKAALLLLAMLQVPMAWPQTPVPATLAARATLVLKKPLKGEPIRGFSSITAQADGMYWVMADTGHAAAAGAARRDSLVVFHHMHIDWIGARATLVSTQALHDPERRLPFKIVNDATKARLLTAADLNVDAMQIVEDTIWLADDSGPYLVGSDRRGRVVGVFEAKLNGQRLTSTQVRRGFGGLARSRDGRFLYAAFEGPLWSESQSGWESADGRPYAWVLEFDLRRRDWSGRALKYAFDAEGRTIADLSLIDERNALVIERGPDFRRVYRVSMEPAMQKTRYVDLLTIKLSAVEGLDIIAPADIVLTSGDRSELILMRAPQLLGVGFLP